MAAMRRQELPSRAPEWAGVELTIAGTRQVLSTFTGKGTGIDKLLIAELKQLPDEGIQGLNAVLGEVIRRIAFPLEALVALIHLLPKKLGGLRPIAVMSLLYRVMLRL